MKQLKAFFFFLTFLVLTNAALAETKTVALPDLPPLISLGANNQPQGQYVDLLTGLLGKIDVESRYRILPWRRALSEVAKGRSDMTIVASNIGTAKKDFYLSEPIAQRNIVFVSPKSKKIPPLHKLEDCAQYPVAVIAGDSLESELAGRGIPYQTVPDIDLGIKMLASNRFDVLLTYELVAWSQAYSTGYSHQLDFHFLHALPLYIGLSKQDPSHKKLLLRINQSIEEMKHQNMR